MLTARIEKASSIIKVADGLLLSSNIITFCFSADGVRVMTLSPPLTSLHVSQNGFLEYRCDSQFSVTTTIRKLLDLLADAVEAEAVSIQSFIDGSALSFVYESVEGGKKSDTFRIESTFPLYNMKLNYDPYCSLEMSTAEFVNLATLVSVSSPTVSFLCSASLVSLNFEVNGNLRVFDLPSPDYIGLTPPQTPFEVIIKSTDLVRCSVIGLSENLTLHFCFSSPLIVEYELIKRNVSAGRLLYSVPPSI